MSPQQRSLFAHDPVEPTSWEHAVAADQWIARVVVNRPLNRPFDYLVPDPLREHLQPGMRVRVPFGGGNQLLVGY